MMMTASASNNKAQQTSFFFDKEGNWFHEGVQITHPRTCLLFSKNLHKGSDGRYYIKISHESAEVTIEDTPYIIKSVSFKTGSRDDENEYLIHLNDTSQEYLAPQTLEINNHNVMYCWVKNRAEKARFLRPAYYQLCSHIQFDENTEQYWLPWKGQKTIICINE